MDVKVCPIRFVCCSSDKNSTRSNTLLVGGDIFNLENLLFFKSFFSLPKHFVDIGKPKTVLNLSSVSNENRRFYRQHKRIFAVIYRTTSEYFCRRLADWGTVSYILISLASSELRLTSDWCGMRPTNLMQVLTLNDDEIKIIEPVL